MFLVPCNKQQKKKRKTTSHLIWDPPEEAFAKIAKHEEEETKEKKDSIVPILGERIYINNHVSDIVTAIQFSPARVVVGISLGSHPGRLLNVYERKKIGGQWEFVFMHGNEEIDLMRSRNTAAAGWIHYVCAHEHFYNIPGDVWRIVVGYVSTSFGAARLEDFE